MKHVISLVYSATALVGLYFAVYLAMTGLYGVPFSLWYIVIFVGAVLMLIGVLLWWASTSQWTRWFPVAGSFLLAAYFVPAFIVVLREGGADLVRVGIVALVIGSFVIAIRELRTQAGRVLVPPYTKQ